MRKWALVFLWMAATAFTASALSLCDYRMPETNIIELKSSFNYRYYRDPTRPNADINSGRLSLSYSQLYDSSLMGFEVAAGGDFVLRALSLASLDSQARGRMQRYFGAETPFFAYGGVDGLFATGYVQPGLTVEAGLGYGRFSDVTPLAKALRAERTLLDMGAVVASLPDELVMQLAEEIGRAGEYETMAELLSEVEELFLEVTDTRLDAQALLALEEIILDTGWERFCGWNVTFGATYDVLDPRGEDRDVMVRVAGDVALAPEPGSQMRLSASYSIVPDPTFRRSTVRLSASYDYRLNDITRFNAAYGLRHDFFVDESEGTQSAAFELAFNLGGVEAAVQLSFSKPAGWDEWTQDMVFSAVVHLL